MIKDPVIAVCDHIRDELLARGFKSQRLPHGDFVRVMLYLGVSPALSSMFVSCDTIVVGYDDCAGNSRGIGDIRIGFDLASPTSIQDAIEAAIEAANLKWQRRKQLNLSKFDP